METNGKPNSEIFIELFTEIEQSLKEICNDTYHSNFGELLRKARGLHPVVQQFATDLKEYAQLRNAITHTRRENFVIAEPHDDVVKDIRRIRNLLSNPPKISTVMKRKPYFATPQTPLMEMLDTFASKGFMRCPVVDSGRVVCIVTAKTLAKWMTSKHESTVNYSKASLADIIPYADGNDFTIVSENSDVVSLVGQFKNAMKKGNYLQAVVVTRTGRADSPIVGLLAPSDFPLLLEQMS
ncbi:MAG TPA: CBS domain-containing protein [Tenuifilaceae bacterium]|nr:CBS domain-containing protein [Tenuifilaceae bacterium]HQB79160.1 CBS domain-containing protein [Tenuifilaceae bacterium]